MSSKADADPEGADQTGLLEVAGAQQEMFRKTVYVLHSAPLQPLTLTQRRLANAWLKFAIETEPADEGWWTMPMSRLRRDIAFPSNNIAFLREAARNIGGVRFEWDVLAPDNKRVKWVTQALFPAVAIADGYVQFQIGTEIYRELRRPEVYGLIDMAVMRRLTTVASLQIWEHCVRFENIGQTKSMRWEEFRDKVLGHGDKTSYKEYKTFKLRVLGKATEEINRETDHHIELIEIKEGRRVAEIQFKVRRKYQPEHSGSDKSVQMLNSMARIGVPRTEAQRLVEQYLIEDIAAALSYTERRMTDTHQGRLEKPAAYFRKALEMGWGREDRLTSTTEAGSGKKKQEEIFDIKEAFNETQRQKAREYYSKLDEAEKSSLAEEYNKQQEVPQFKVKPKMSKGAEVAFMDWVAKQTWGDPTPEELLNFSAKLLATRRPI